MPLAATFALALSAAITPVVPQVGAPQPIQIPAAQTIQQYVENYFADAPVMIKIAQCESRFRQFAKDGSVLQNPKSTAVGVFQIMSSIHKDLADQKLGLNIDTLEGNVAYAKQLYQEKGTQPWVSSAPCWNKGVDKDKIALK